MDKGDLPPKFSASLEEAARKHPLPRTKPYPGTEESFMEAVRKYQLPRAEPYPASHTMERLSRERREEQEAQQRVDDNVYNIFGDIFGDEDSHIQEQQPVPEETRAIPKEPYHVRARRGESSQQPQ